ncbi:MAG: hypothetical protein LAN63_19265 [Acidobacteriia bacterium]|nr:hypothetical protein [Terriglobia bacterium]
MEQGELIHLEAFQHNSTVADKEPDWGSVDKTKLPRAAFADQGEPDKKSSWGYPHHWVQNGGGEDKNGVYTTGTMYLHRGGLAAAWTAANGARSGQQGSSAVKDHLNAHRKAIGMGEENKKKGESLMEIITKENFASAYPELFASIEKEAFEKGLSEGMEKGKLSGAGSERERIKGVEDQLIPGHEDLIASLKYDGKTTGPEAAVMVLKKEKELMASRHEDLIEDGKKSKVKDANPPDLEKTKEKDPFDRFEEINSAM